MPIVIHPIAGKPINSKTTTLLKVVDENDIGNFPVLPSDSVVIMAPHW
jgi:hypothetical protein